MKYINKFLILFIVIVAFLGCNITKTTNSKISGIRGWNILSDSISQALIAIEKAHEYDINHLQLSHRLIMDLKDVRKSKNLRITKELINKAHRAGIEKVLVWDHSLYSLDYYPDQFKNKQGLINLDNPDFWEWLKDDYRSMLDSLPSMDGIVLTFIETGAHIEDQFSERWTSEAEKLAAVVDALASVIIDERGLELYIRTFIYYKDELNALLNTVNLVKHPEIRIMTKEVPHDFFLTHPVSDFITKFDKKVLIEFDLGHEYNGQGVIASILPKITVERWKYYAKQNNVLGYVARTDRYGNTQNIGRPTEVNLFALKRIAEDTTLSTETIVKEFISQEYGASAVDILTPVFMETEEIITSVFYTLGLHMNFHSKFEFDYASIYGRHCSGKWMNNPVVHVKHGINQEFHYWKDVVENLSPARHKRKTKKDGTITTLYQEAPWVIENSWLTSEDKMNEQYLEYVVLEKEYGVGKALWAVQEIKKAKPLIKDKDKYNEILQLYERTYLSAKLYKAGAMAYFGFRVYLNDSTSQTAIKTAQKGLENILLIVDEIKKYDYPGPIGQFSWVNDTDRAMSLFKNITNGWDRYGGAKLE